MYNIPHYAQKVLETLEKNGFEAYIVGGCVRDFLMKKNPHDFDITTNALPDKTKKCFEEYKIITNGEKHGTIAVVIEGETVEITTYRIDGDYADSRHPESVEFSGNLQEDLGRRDFTMNAMALDKSGRLVDIFDGVKDIEGKVIRTVGNPSDRFEEDALRIMRALRFASQLGFEIESETSKQVHEKAQLLKNISAERIRDEFLKLLCGVNATEILRSYSDVIEIFIPEIRDMYGFLQHTPFHKYDVWEHTLYAVENVRCDPILRMTMLLHDIAKPECFSSDENGVGHFKGHAAFGAKKSMAILDRLRFSSKEKKLITELIENHRNSYSCDTDIKRMMNRIGADNLRLLLEVKKADDMAKGIYSKQDKKQIEFAVKRLDEILENGECYRISDMKIKGNDLTELGLHGSLVGKHLNMLLELIVNNVIDNDREQLIMYAKQLKEVEKW